MVGRDVVVIGGSAGSATPLRKLLHRLPPSTAASLFVVVHRAAGPCPEDVLTDVLAAVTPLPVHTAAHLTSIQGGHVYVCPVDRHMTVENGLIHLDRSPKENHTRPSIDVLFRSAALSYGRRLIGVLLSGALKDGTAGLWQIKRRGGIAIVQQPFGAEFPGIPWNAIEKVAVDFFCQRSRSETSWLR